MAVRRTVDADHSMNSAWVIRLAGFGDYPLANELSERHAKALAKRINELLAMTEDELCPPSCHCCGVPGNVNALANYDLALCNNAGSGTRHLLCGGCVGAIRKDASKLANK